MNVVRGSVDSTCYAGIRTNRKKFKHVITYNGLWSCRRIIINGDDYFSGNVIPKITIIFNVLKPPTVKFLISKRREIIINAADYFSGNVIPK